MSRLSRAVNTFFGVLAFCLVVAAAAGAYFFYQEKQKLDEAQARDSLQRADLLARKLEKRTLPAQYAAEVEQAKKDLELAQGIFRKRQYGPCLQQVEDVMSRLRPIEGEMENPRESARLLASAGGCTVRRASALQGEALKEGGEVRMGDGVETGGDGSLLLSFPNGESLALQPGSALELMSLPGQAGETAVAVRLSRGSLYYRSPRVVRDEYACRVEAGGGAARSRSGSAFWVSASGSEGFDVQALEGEVHVSLGKVSGELRGGLEAQTASVSQSGVKAGAPLMAPPQTLTPAEGQIFRVRSGASATVPLRWEPSRASAVRVQIADNPLFAKGLRMDGTVTGLSASVGALPEGTYYWRLRSACGEGRGFWGSAVRFSVFGVQGEPRTPADWVLDVEATPVGDSVLLKGSVKPRVRLTVNEVEVAVDENGTFLGTFTLPARGPKGRPVVVCAFDDKGNEKTWSKSF